MEKLAEKKIEMSGVTEEMYDAFILIYILCFFNLMFFVAQIIQMVFLKKLDRKFEFPTLSFFSDCVLFVASIINIDWIRKNISKDLDHTGLSEEEIFFRKVANFNVIVDYKFEYLLAIMISCLIFKVLDLIQFSADIGPLVKIVGKMLGDFLNFFILYAILVIMFAVVGNLNFIFYLDEYTGLFESCETVLDASVGNYDFTLFD